MRKKTQKGFTAAIIIAAIGLGALFSARPWQAWEHQVEARQSAEQELLATEKRHIELLKERALAESRSGREAGARKDGMIGPGERLIDED
jgi:hypothetical protein